MSYQESYYKGNSDYFIDCTGDATKGDHVTFQKAIFTGSFKRPKFSHFEIVFGEIIKDSYGAEKQQHTFTLLLSNGQQMRIKGRNLYKNGLFRKPWSQEEKRALSLNEKHTRGDIARKDREERKHC